MAGELKEYKVLHGVISHSGKKYQPGQIIKLADVHADSLLKLKPAQIEMIEQPKQEEPADAGDAAKAKAKPKGESKPEAAEK
jgi:hypothetical protein